jgi:ferredoxin-nitrite reductase
MNRIEQLKADKDGLRVGEDLDRFVAQGLESLTDDDIDRLKWWGIFLRKQTPGHFMLRVRMPRGIANAEQLRALGEISQRYGRNRATSPRVSSCSCAGSACRIFRGFCSACGKWGW